MATQTFPFAEFGNGIVRVEIDVNDTNWRPSRVRCINNSTQPAAARILENGVEVFTATAPAGQTTTWNISGVQLGWDTVNGGLMMGNYALQAQWPG